MFRSIEVSLVRKRNERLLQEIRADRAGRYLLSRRLAPQFY
ncbi:MAG TPA: hypothetical protein VGV91_05600 [Rubrobacter sp.]|nr:hypothetical protein [Rubrobacter sp.]